MPYIVLVTGAASGLGNGFAQHYLGQQHTTVVMADRAYTHPKPKELESFPGSYTIHVDLSSQQSIAALTQNIRAINIKALDLVIHSAGIRGLVPTVEAQYPSDVQAAENLHVMTPDTMLKTLEINTVGTFNLLQDLYTSNLFHPRGTIQTKVILMTSRMGSIGHNVVGGSYAYRASKAALNAIIKSMSIDIPHVIFALVHPGRVETGLTKCREEGAIEVQESVGDMLRLIEKLEEKDSARYMDRFGVAIEW